MNFLQPGELIGGRYEIIDELGEGAFGETYLAKDTQLPGHPPCVVKRLKPQNKNINSKILEFFEQEAKMLAWLGKHDQIPQLLAHFEQHQEFYLVQELIEGHDLSKEILQGNRLSEDSVIALLRAILEVLEFVHQHKVIHRDIKPSNIIKRQKDNKIVLIDFGAVKQISTQMANYSGQIGFTVTIGTPGYMPSEQNSGEPKFNSDIYAVGIIAIEALTGIFPDKLPKDPDTGEISWRDKANVNSGLADILDKMVRYDYRQRYQTVAEVLEAIANFINPPPPPLPNPAPKKVMNEKLKVIFLFGAIVVSIVAAIIGIQNLFQKPVVVVSPTPAPTPIPSGSPTPTLSATPVSLLTYENPPKKIKIKYPSNWERQDIENQFTSELTKFISPKENAADNFQEYLVVSVEQLPEKSLSLDEYTTSAISEINQNTRNANIIDSSTATFANRPAHKVVFTGTNEQASQIQRMQIWTLKDNKVYFITYTAEPATYANYLNTAEEIIKSFEIVESP